MRLGDLTPGDVFYLAHDLDAGPLVRMYSTAHVDDDHFVLAAFLDPRIGISERFMYYDSEVIKVGRIEHGYT